jgi:hypothetical protein
MASQQAERYEAGHDVCSDVASHDACVSLLIDHLAGGLINVLAFVALQLDTAYHYSVMKKKNLCKQEKQCFCIHGSAKQSVPGSGRGSSNKSDPATAWYHKHWRPVNHTSYPIQVYESA